MNCPICDSTNLKVTNVRSKESKKYRRRKCIDCGENFTTYEVNTAMLMELFEEHFSMDVTSQIADILEKEFPERMRNQDDKI